MTNFKVKVLLNRGRDNQTTITFVAVVSFHWRLTKTKNLYSQINHALQWYREVTYKNTTQHIHDK